MGLIVPKEGEAEMLLRVLEIDAGTEEGVDVQRGGAVKLRLYYNDRTPDDSTTIWEGTDPGVNPPDANELQEIDSYAGKSTTGEANYAPITLSTSSWDVGGLSSDPPVVSYPDSSLTFTLDGGDSGYAVYGYFVTVEKSVGDPNPVILWAEKFPTPFNIASTGGQIKITLKLEAE